jgi:hypothetical protein
MKTRFVILDNKGETFDRYTIIDKTTADVYGASDNPFHPQGFGQFNHNIADSYWNVAYGLNWRERINAKKAIKDSVNKYLNDTKNLGEPIDMDNLPQAVKLYIKYIAQCK